MIRRFANLPLLTVADAAPTRPDFEVLGVFNPGAVRVEGRTLLLVRVAERPKQEPGYRSTVLLDPDRPGELLVRRFAEDDPGLDAGHPTSFHYRGQMYLTSLSHLRLARVSADGRSLVLDAVPSLFPTGAYEAFGVEDPRVTALDGWYYVAYTAVSPRGIVPWLARTRDFVAYERLGAMFPPDNKDVALFPEKIGGRYFAFHRPCGGRPSMWIASSPDLRDWGGHRFLMGPRPGAWDAGRVGCGGPPLKTGRGWLQLYHGAAPLPGGGQRYCLGAVLLDLREPWRIVKRLDEPVLVPELPCEVDGFVPDVVFLNGLVDRGDGTADLYYAGGDDCLCGARLDIEALLARMFR